MVGSNSTNKEGIKYARQIYKHLINNNIYNKAKNLYTDVTNNTINERTAFDQLNKMDKKITQIMLTSEIDNCSKKDQTMWTPAIKQSNLRIQYWNIKK
jgi:hypothetical protein